MTLEAVLTKLMWILPQTKDAGQVKRLLGQCINRDILWTLQIKMIWHDITLCFIG